MTSGDEIKVLYTLFLTISHSMKLIACNFYVFNTFFKKKIQKQEYYM